ncbi:MAG TPA: MgtC/SapB family protein [Actinomycetota bacterium]|nr:MgtC/SapB family protein [Actinomycetota bacterium]
MEWELLGRIALAALLGWLVGLWHEASRPPGAARAGPRTYGLVCLGAAVVNALAPSAEVAGGTLAGVGFLGAGLLLRGGDGAAVGFYMAASLWAATAVGIVVGRGALALGAVTTLVVLVVLHSDHLPGRRRLEDGVRALFARARRDGR